MIKQKQRQFFGKKLKKTLSAALLSLALLVSPFKQLTEINSGITHYKKEEVHKAREPVFFIGEIHNYTKYYYEKASEVLPELKKAGYNNLLLECNTDNNIYIEKYQKYHNKNQRKSEYFLKIIRDRFEKQMAKTEYVETYINLIKRATDLGIYAYCIDLNIEYILEGLSSKNPDDTKKLRQRMSDALEKREEFLTLNVLNFVKQKNKVIIYIGEAHALDETIFYHINEIKTKKNEIFKVKLREEVKPLSKRLLELYIPLASFDVEPYYYYY
jgi:hypothetical protein